MGYDVNRLFVWFRPGKALGVPFFNRDVYVNVTGEVIVEPAIDLAVSASDSFQAIRT